MKKTCRKSERGSALVYILIAIALLAALTVTFMEPSSQQTSSQSQFRSTAALQGQIDTIRSAVQECVLRYPNGDQAAAINTSDPDANRSYPLKPNSTYLDTPASNRNASGIRCPGNPQGGDATDHGPIFSGATGRFLPAPPDLFNDWQWYNGTDGVFFWISTSNSDAFLKTSLEKLDEKFGECEADVIDATGSAINLDVAGDVSCASGDLCFRVWVINPGTGRHADVSEPDGTACGATDL